MVYPTYRFGLDPGRFCTTSSFARPRSCGDCVVRAIEDASDVIKGWSWVEGCQGHPTPQRVEPFERRDRLSAGEFAFAVPLLNQATRRRGGSASALRLLIKANR